MSKKIKEFAYILFIFSSRITENGIYFAKMGSKIDLFSSINSDSFLLFHEVNPGLAKNIVKIDSLAKNIHTNQLIITV